MLAFLESLRVFQNNKALKLSSPVHLEAVGLRVFQNNKALKRNQLENVLRSSLRVFQNNKALKLPNRLFDG